MICAVLVLDIHRQEPVTETMKYKVVGTCITPLMLDLMTAANVLEH